MLKDINFPEINGVSVAVAFSEKDGTEEWMVHIINENDTPLENVMVVSKGYGTVKDERVKTSTLRRFFEQIPANSAQQIEPIPKELFGLTNEYWLSFYINKKVFDKKFLFTPGALNKQLFTQLPIIDQKGILHS